MNAENYLKRLDYRGSTSPNLINLKAIHKKHLYNIPFENLDIHSNKKIILDTDKLEEKMLSSKRGGYCYELNGMFYALLQEMGYNVKMVSARVNNGKGGWGAEFDHLLIITELDELWMTDVGFGDSFLEPLSVKLNNPQKNAKGWFKITQNEEDEYLKMSKSVDDNLYEDEFIFTLKERSWDEFEDMNSYHQTSPESHFTRGKICSIATEGGRISLTDQKLILSEGADKKTIEVKDEMDFERKLFEYFGIKLNG